MSFKQIAVKTLKNSGARITKPRMAVIDCLDQSHEPLTAKEITESIQSDANQVDMDPVTTYRILDRFRELGLIHQINPSGRYMTCTHLKCQEEYHVLLRCRNCQKVQEQHVPKHVMAPFFAYLSHQLQFHAGQDVFQLDGYCSSCAVPESSHRA
ncbi:MAG: Fur family transcriptional regulator [Oligoflexus sp.]